LDVTGKVRLTLLILDWLAGVVLTELSIEPEVL
jgi:hypothetical protein